MKSSVWKIAERPGVVGAKLNSDHRDGSDCSVKMKPSEMRWSAGIVCQGERHGRGWEAGLTARDSEAW